jgi:hypothetical protein
MAVDDLISQIMATEGMGEPGAGAGGNLADLFPTQLSPSSPAPMQAARLVAPKPTADMVPGAGVDAYRRAQEVRAQTEQPPAPAAMAQANARVDDLVAGLRARPEESAPAVAAVREAAPAAVAEAEAAPEKPKFQSRFRPQFEQAKAELEQLKASIPAGAAISPEQASELRNLSGVVSRLQGLVAAEEGAVVDAERAALLERQTQRLGREEELIERSRRLAPGNALIAFGTALAGAKPGEKFASALTRGLAAGNESYTGARDARDASLRGIEEKRDAYTLQKIEAIQSARDKAIEMANAGVELTKEGYALANLEDADVVKLATQGDVIKTAKATASKAETEALYAPRVFEAELESQGALAEQRRRPPVSSGGSGDKGMTENQRQTKIGDLNKERRGLMIKLNSATTVGEERKAVKLALQYIDEELAGLKGGRPPAAGGTRTRTYNPKTGKLE